MDDKENNFYVRLHNIDYQSTKELDLLLSDDFDPQTRDFSLENQLIGNVRRYITEIEQQNCCEEIGKRFLDNINNQRIKNSFESCKEKVNFASRNVRTLEYIDSLASYPTPNKLEDITLKDFYQIKKEFFKNLPCEESITDFKLRTSKFDYDFSGKKLPNQLSNQTINESKVQNSFNFNRNILNQNLNQNKEEQIQQNSQRSLLYKANNSNPIYGNIPSERSLPNPATNNFAKPNNPPTLPVTIKYEPIRSTKRRNEDEIDKEKYDNVDLSTIPFKSAREQLALDNAKNQQNSETSSHYSMAKRPMINNPSICNNNNNSNNNNPPAKRGIHSKFNLPIKNNNSDDNKQNSMANGNQQIQGAEIAALKNMDQKLIEIIMSEMMDKTPPVTWNHICGLEFQKETIKEIVIWPMIRPDIFKGLRGPPKGLLLFGPPGTGKTLFAKCIANESQSSFFNISASTLTSKWQGESEKLVKVLYEVARAYQPAVIFIDEIDSLLAKRSDDDRESSRRLKTEFFIQMDGAKTSSDERILTIGATNRPQELDDAARRRFVKKLLIPLPEKVGRRQIIINLMSTMSCSMTEEEIDNIAELTEGYSGADMSNLCQEAALGPIRCLKSNGMCSISQISADEVREINHHDFINAMMQVKASVSQDDLNEYYEWNKSFGSNAI